MLNWPEACIAWGISHPDLLRPSDFWPMAWIPPSMPCPSPASLRLQSLGFSTPSNASGLETLSSGLAFLQQVGYAEQYMDVGKVRHTTRLGKQGALANLLAWAGQPT